jgi:hypothetical protein
VVAALEERGIPREKITPKMIEALLSGSEDDIHDRAVGMTEASVVDVEPVEDD